MKTNPQNFTKSNANFADWGRQCIYVSKSNVCIYGGLHVILHNYFSFILALESSVSPVTHCKSRDVCLSGKQLFAAVWLFLELQLPRTIAIKSQTQYFCFSLYSQKGKHFLWSKWKGSGTILWQSTNNWFHHVVKKGDRASSHESSIVFSSSDFLRYEWISREAMLSAFATEDWNLSQQIVLQGIRYWNIYSNSEFVDSLLQAGGCLGWDDGSHFCYF